MFENGSKIVSFKIIDSLGCPQNTYITSYKQADRQSDILRYMDRVIAGIHSKCQRNNAECTVE